MQKRQWKKFSVSKFKSIFFGNQRKAFITNISIASSVFDRSVNVLAPHIQELTEWKWWKVLLLPITNDLQTTGFVFPIKFIKRVFTFGQPFIQSSFLFLRSKNRYSEKAKKAFSPFIIVCDQNQRSEFFYQGHDHRFSSRRKSTRLISLLLLLARESYKVF